MLGTANGQLLVQNSNSICAYNFDGTVLNSAFITGLSNPQGIATSGTNLYVVNFGNGTIGKYNLDGTIVTASLISGLNGPQGIAISGTNLYVASFFGNAVGKYSTSGAVLNSSLIPLQSADGIAISGTNLYVAYAGSKIGSFNSDGTVVNPALISGLSNPAGIAISGTNLFVPNFGNGTIGKYNLSGAVVNATLISGLSEPNGIAISGSILFVQNAGSCTVGEYTLDGTMINASLISKATPAGYIGYGIQVLQPPVTWVSTATARAIVTNAFVVGATMTGGGYGYTNTPIVRIIGGGGSGAEAVAVVTNGVVIAVNILDAGHGYTSKPVIVIAPPFIEQPTMGVAPLSLLSFTNLLLGTNYQIQRFLGDTWSNIGAVFTATSTAFTQYVPGTAGPDAYRLAAAPVPTQAYAIARLDGGFVVGATVTSGGSGYTNSPAVNIKGGGGTNATAVANVSGGAVTGITITSAGIGYTSTPTLLIAPPQAPATALWPNVTQVMKLDLGSLSPYDNYQLEFTPIAAGGWSSLGTPFTPTSTTNTQYINVSGAVGFFRARYVP
jgi:hypothetical protein